MELEVKFSEQPVDYLEAVKFMENRVNGIIDGSEREMLWFLEHEAVLTAGTSAKDCELIDHDSNIPVFKSGRGGKFTYHGPGQRIVYVMLDLDKRNLKDIRKFVYKLEEWLIKALEIQNIEGKVKKDRVGIWVEPSMNNQIKIESKIAAIGIRVKKWVSFHGLAINISPNMSHYKKIIPCGIKQFGVTSVDDLHGVRTKTNVKQFDQILLDSFNVFFK